mmetsp:Transcript_36267/g.55706  ORF Transcript_36267/g.55706 Transcript_36267/m.55706 type:complete len:82 (+) Transcript_36267:94-339(+)
MESPHDEDNIENLPSGRLDNFFSLDFALAADFLKRPTKEQVSSVTLNYNSKTVGSLENKGPKLLNGPLILSPEMHNLVHSL